MNNNKIFTDYLRYITTTFIIFSGLLTMVATGGGSDSANDDATQDLAYDEIREYEGKELSSINDFRENSILGPQHIDQESYKLKVTGLVKTPTEHSYEEILNNHENFKKVETMYCVEGWSVTLLWEGVPVKDLIEEAGLMSTAKVIIFHSYDGFTTSFPIDYIMDYNIIMAYKMNEVILPPQRGFPFQLVAEDKWGYKWAKWITQIELSDDENYKGYWEARGYSNSGSLYECSPGPISAQPSGHTERTDCCTCHSAN